MVESNTARRKQIKRRLRAISLAPSAPGAAAEAQRLMAEYRRLTSADPAPAAARSVAPPRGLSEQDAAAIATWPAEPRARVYGGSMARVVTPWRS